MWATFASRSVYTEASRHPRPHIRDVIASPLRWEEIDLVLCCGLSRHAFFYQQTAFEPEKWCE